MFVTRIAILSIADRRLARIDPEDLAAEIEADRWAAKQTSQDQSQPHDMKQIRRSCDCGHPDSDR